MKRILNLILVFFLFTPSFSQISIFDILFGDDEDESHQEFLGIPMEGSVSSFVEKLSKKGYTIKKKDEFGDYWLQGKFQGYLSEINVAGTVKTKQVHKVVVHFNKYKDWASAKNRYLSFRKKLLEKYDENEEEIQKYTKSVGKNGKIEEEICYFSSFYGSHGEIWLLMEDYGLALIYTDDINDKLNDDELEEVREERQTTQDNRNNSASAPTYESKVSIIDNIKSRLPRNISVYDMIQYECGLKELGKPFSNEYASLFDKFISLGWASKGWHSIRTENNLKVLGKEIDHISYVENSKDYTYFFKFEDDKSAKKFINLIKKDFSQFAFIYFERKDTDISIIYKLNNPIQNIEQIALRSLGGTTISITLYASALIPNFPQ